MLDLRPGCVVGGAVVGEFMLGRMSCFNPNTHRILPRRVGHLNLRGTFITASGSLVGFNITSGILGILRGTNVPCRVFDRVGPGPAMDGMGTKIRTFTGSKTSFVLTVNNNSSVSASGTVNVVAGGPSFDSIISLRNITPAEGGSIPVVTLPAATNATTRIAVGCIVASRRGRGGVIYMSPGSVPTVTVISTRLVCALPGKLATSANLSTLARTVRKLVAGNT